MGRQRQGDAATARSTWAPRSQTAGWASPGASEGAQPTAPCLQTPGLQTATE